MVHALSAVDSLRATEAATFSDAAHHAFILDTSDKRFTSLHLSPSPSISQLSFLL